MQKITDQMIVEALKAWDAAIKDAASTPGVTRPWPRTVYMRAALEAALVPSTKEVKKT